MRSSRIYTTVPVRSCALGNFSVLAVSGSAISVGALRRRRERPADNNYVVVAYQECPLRLQADDAAGFRADIQVGVVVGSFRAVVQLAWSSPGAFCHAQPPGIAPPAYGPEA